MHFTIYMYLYLYSYRRETARQLRMYAQLTVCFSAVAELLVPSHYHSAPSLPMFPLEFRSEVNYEETRVMGLSSTSSEYPVIVA